MEFHAVKLGFTYFGCEIYRMEIVDGKMKGTYLGKMLSRREKISVLLEGIFYALLGGYFFGISEYRDKKREAGEERKKGFLLSCKKKWKFVVERNILEEIAKLLMHHNKVLFIKFLLNWKITDTFLTNFLYLSSLFSILGKCLNKTKQ